MEESELLAEARRRTNSAERESFLEQACAGDAELRSRIERAVTEQLQSRATVELSSQADLTVDSFPVQPSNLFTGADPDLPTAQGSVVVPILPSAAGWGDQVGSVIGGRYTLIKEIGAGGMGSVYLAEQSLPVRRQVALKLIRSGMDSRGTLARFDAERQALALMDHPNIARIFDGGLTPSGQPYFVMELVNGVPLTDYCDQKRLSVKARLELFVPVCLAVQHAHQKGIIHRDLKPSNVLVTEIDGRPTPKVIDFGVAKATEFKLTDASYADVGSIVGTPVYMSPEQADPSSMDIDTRTDVYALGVMLYELLVGSPPIDARDLRRGAILETLRMVREVDPPRPSTRLTAQTSRPHIAANRGIDPARLARLLEGELDWVVMKALEKDRDRRYETAIGFAIDIQRYLADQMVEARPPSPGYRLRKFVKRNKLQVIAASLVLLALVAGIAGTTAGLREAKRQERKALAAAAQERTAKQREAEHAEGERQAKELANLRALEAERNLSFAKKGNQILGSVFAGLNPSKIAESGRPLQDLLRQNLVKAVDQLENAAIADPTEAARMQLTLGTSLLGLGEYAPALAVLEKASSTLETRLGPDDPTTLSAWNSLSQGYLTDGKLDKALPLLERALPLMKAKLGPDHPSTLTAMNNLAMAYKGTGKYDRAMPLLEEARTVEQARLGPDHRDTLITTGNLATVYCVSGKLDRALPLLEATLPTMKAKLGPDHPITLTGMNNLATIYWATGKLDKALPLHEAVLALKDKKLGRDHPDTLLTAGNLGVNYKDAGRYAEATPLLEQVHRASRSNPTLPSATMELQEAYVRTNALDKLSLLLEEQLTELRQSQPKDSPQLAKLLGTAGQILLQQKRWAEAEAILRENLAIRERTQPDAASTAIARTLLGAALLGQQKDAEAAPLLLEGYAGMKRNEARIPPPQIQRATETIEQLIHLYESTHQNDRAKDLRTKLDAINAQPKQP